MVYNNCFDNAGSVVPSKTRANDNESVVNILRPRRRNNTRSTTGNLISCPALRAIWLSSTNVRPRGEKSARFAAFFRAFGPQPVRWNILFQGEGRECHNSGSHCRARAYISLCRAKGEKTRRGPANERRLPVAKTRPRGRALRTTKIARQ